MQINLSEEIEEAKDKLIVVEGKKDKKSLQELGFKYIFVINETGKSLYEKMEEIEMQKRKICILTDFDKKGKKLYLLLKSELAKKKVKTDNTLRFILLKSGVSHIEGLSTFIQNQEIKGK